VEGVRRPGRGGMFFKCGQVGGPGGWRPPIAGRGPLGGFFKKSQLIKAKGRRGQEKKGSGSGEKGVGTADVRNTGEWEM